MKHDEILASLAVLVLSGVLVYLTKVGLLTIGHANRKSMSISANQAVAADEITAAGGDPGSLIQGASIYLANAPWPFGPNVGNVIPPNSAGVTLPGADAANFLGFAAS
jgi:hypothetical protein